MIKSTAENIDVIVVGTEHCDLYMIDSQAFTVLATFKLQSVPVSICTYGIFLFSEEFFRDLFFRNI